MSGDEATWGAGDDEPEFAADSPADIAGDAILTALTAIGLELSRIANAVEVIGGLLEEPPIQRVMNVDSR